MKHEFPRRDLLAATISAMLGALMTGPVLAQSQDAEAAHDHDRPLGSREPMSRDPG